MKPSTRIESIASRAYRGAVLVGSIAVAFSCSDQPPVAPRQVPPGFARMSVKPVYQTTVSGGPTIVADKAVGILRGPNGDSVVVTAKFDGDSAVLLFDVPITGSSAKYTLDLTEFDASGQSVYHGTQEYTLKPGNNDGLAPPVLVYSAPDAKLAFLHVSPSSALLNSGASTGFAVSGTTSSGQSVSPIHVGWTTKNATIATVDDNGVVIAGKFQASTYIIARTVLGLADSAIVTVHAPVDHVVASPASLQLLRGATGAVAAELRDAGNNLIDDRSVTWSSGDETIATVTSTGVVQALKIGTTTLTASAEGKVGTVPVTVVSPVDHIELTPSSLTFASLGETQAVSGRIVARTGASVAGLSLAFSSSNAAVASVDNSGTVTANANGSATITASVDGMTATAAVSVQQVPTSISVSPASVITTSLGETRPFLATIVDARGNAVTGVTITWSSSDTHVASISSTGVATANSVGSATLTATAGGKSGSATMYVTQQPASIRVFSDRTSLNVGDVATLSAKSFDARGNLIGGASATWSTSTPSVVAISGNRATAIGPGTGTVTGTVGGLAASINLFVTGVARSGAVSGQVINAATGLGIAGARVGLFGDTAGVSADASGQFTLNNVPDGATLAISATGFIATQYFSVHTTAGTTAGLGSLPLSPVSSANASFSGRVIDAVTSLSIPNAQLAVRSGINATAGNSVTTATSDANGNYSATLAAGTYTVTASAFGYAAAGGTVPAVGGVTLANQNLVLSPSGLSNTQFRIVLQWDASPPDLDGHLVGPNGTGTNFEIAYYSKSYVVNGDTIAKQDQDVTDGFGPETITLSQTTAGKYRYYVHLFCCGSDGNAETPGAFGNARVTVFRGSSVAAQFSAPQQTGSVWTVFEIDGATGSVSSINTISQTYNIPTSGTASFNRIPRPGAPDDVAAMLQRIKQHPKPKPHPTENK